MSSKCHKYCVIKHTLFRFYINANSLLKLTLKGGCHKKCQLNELLLIHLSEKCIVSFSKIRVI